MMRYDELSDEAKARAYPPQDERRLELVSQLCVAGMNNSREAYAKQIKDGDLYREDGTCRHYWHLTATQHPPVPPDRQGRWKPVPGGSYSEPAWVWDDWGPR